MEEKKEEVSFRVKGEVGGEQTSPEIPDMPQIDEEPTPKSPAEEP